MLACLLRLLSCTVLAAALRTPLGAARLSDPADHGLALSEREGTDLESSIQSIVHGDSGKELEGAWASYQADLASGIRRTFSPDSTRFRVLVVSAVKGTPSSLVDSFRYNMKRLVGNEAGDVFEFALFHYDNHDAEWRKHHWYTAEGGAVVMRRTTPLCKAQAWTLVTPDMAAQYDYIWLMDGDLRLDVFSWDLYRTVLSTLKPLVSQPAVIGKKLGARSTDKHKLRMTGRDKGLFPIAREVERTETMAPLISTRLWPAVYERMQHADLHSVWFLNDVWDMAAHMSEIECGQTGALLVNAAPVRHMDHNDLFEAEKVPERMVTCVRGCGQDGANCRPLSRSEAQLLSDGLRGVCDVRRSPGLACTSNVSSCRDQLWQGLSKREWVESNGSIRVVKYRCNPAQGSLKKRLLDDCEAIE